MEDDLPPLVGEDGQELPPEPSASAEAAASAAPVEEVPEVQGEPSVLGAIGLHPEPLKDVETF